MRPTFQGIIRFPTTAKVGSSAHIALLKAQQIEDWFCQILDGDMTVEEAAGRYATLASDAN